jgi:hypothetical protein
VDTKIPELLAISTPKESQKSYKHHMEKCPSGYGETLEAIEVRVGFGRACSSLVFVDTLVVVIERLRDTFLCGFPSIQLRVVFFAGLESLSGLS